MGKEISLNFTIGVFSTLYLEFEIKTKKIILRTGLSTMYGAGRTVGTESNSRKMSKIR